MVEEIIPSYFCRRIHKYLHGEKMEDISQRVVVHCDYYPNRSLFTDRCQLEKAKGEKCLVKLAVQKKEKLKLRL